jgi:pteridine reductase
MNDHLNKTSSIALITGAGRRIGSEIARLLHQHGHDVILHYQRAHAGAHALADELNALRPHSARTVQANLLDIENFAHWLAPLGQINVLINNASSYFPTPLGQLKLSDWDDLIGSNLKAPLFLTQACLPLGLNNVVNLIDTKIHTPTAGLSAYFAAKGGLATLTQALAVELAPQIRVNAVAPGHIAWAIEHEPLDGAGQQQELDRTPLHRLGQMQEIAHAVLFLLQNQFVTGVVLPVDGGRRLG